MAGRVPPLQTPLWNGTTPIPDETIDFVPEAFDSLIQGKGVRLVHWKAIPCPIGKVDALDQRVSHGYHNNCNNGFLYIKAGVLTAMFSNNSKNQEQMDVGLVSFANAQVSLSRFYNEPDACGNQVPVIVAPFDRMYMVEQNLRVPNWQLLQTSGTTTERLAFPVVTVEHCVDSDGIELKQDKDFTITPDGLLQWLPGKQPGREVELNRGKVISCRYLYAPFYYVSRMIHEVRVAQITDEYGERTDIMLPQAVMLAREFIFENRANDPNSPVPNDLRQSMSPASGSFGPR